MEKLFKLLLFLFIYSCQVNEIETQVCLDGSCDAQFWINEKVSPQSFIDSNGVWNIEYTGLHYFTLEGVTDQLSPEFIINDVPLIETSYDSNFFFTTNNVQWTYPVYSFLGLFINNNLNKAIPYGYITQTIPQMQEEGIDITNLVGYEINRKTTFNKPYSQTLLQTYSKYTYKPSQKMVYLERFIGQEADIYVQVGFGESRVIKEYKVQVKFVNNF